MIYIKDYQNINEQLFPDRRTDFCDVFECLKGKIITVFTDSGGVSGCGFTGLLTEVRENGIILLTEFPSPPTLPGCVSRVHSKKRRTDRFGTKTFIPLAHVCAVVSNYV